MVTVTVTSGTGAITSKTVTVNVPNNISTYVPYIVNGMVMYNDFGETQLAPVLCDASGGTAAVSVVANPDNSKMPNRSTNVLKYTKTANQWANAFLRLPLSRRFDLTNQSTFKVLVYGTAGDVVLLKLENTDWGGNAWQSGVEANYTIQKSNTWEIATYNFKGVANNGAAGASFAADVTVGPVAMDFYNVVRIMYKAGEGAGSYTFYLDDLSGPGVEGLK